MLVFWEHRLVFLAMPKTGSTAIESALGSVADVVLSRPAALKHASVGHYGDYLAPWLSAAGAEGFETVALMREPRNWLGSWFRSRTQTVADAEMPSVAADFETFVRDYARPDRSPLSDVGSQAEFLRSRTHRSIDHLFRYEEIDTFVAFLEDRLGFEITLPLLNVSPPGALDLSAEGEDLLRAACAEDYRIYDSLGAR